MQQDVKIKCLVVDDEEPAQEILKKFIAGVDSLHLSGVCNNGIEALNFLQHHPIDLLFLDIQMPQLTGTDFVRALKSPPKIIFTTAYHTFAVEAFELEASDYLVKPFSFTRFIRAVNKVLNFCASDTQEISFQHTVETRTEDQLPFMYFRSDRKMIKVFLADIIYIECLKDYIKIITAAKQILTKQSLSSLEEMLPHDLFVRIHRSYIVALNKIDTYSQHAIEINKVELPIGKLYRNEVNRQLTTVCRF
jgi:DNA-binding LytR/AlgR family response regulator